MLASAAVSGDQIPFLQLICVPEQDDESYWSIMRGTDECKFGGPGSSVNFWDDQQVGGSLDDSAAAKQAGNPGSLSTCKISLFQLLPYALASLSCIFCASIMSVVRRSMPNCTVSCNLYCCGDLASKYAICQRLAHFFKWLLVT